MDTNLSPATQGFVICIRALLEEGDSLRSMLAKSEAEVARLRERVAELEATP